MLEKKNFTRQLLTNWNVWIAFCCGTFAKTHSRVSRRRIFFLSSYSPEIRIETRRGWKMFVRRGRWRVKFSFSRVSPRESARVPERSSRVGSRLISASVNSEWFPERLPNYVVRARRVVIWFIDQKLGEATQLPLDQYLFSVALPLVRKILSKVGEHFSWFQKVKEIKRRLV